MLFAKTDRSPPGYAPAGNGLSQAIKEMRSDLVGLLAAIEARIDFPDEVGDMEPEAIRQVIDDVSGNCQDAGNSRYRQASSGGYRYCHCGQAQCGKSSLLNRLVRENRAIVTDVPGTTRDVIEEVVNIGGFPFVVRDTAGIRRTEDVVEKIGVERAIALMEGADLVLCVVDGSSPLEDDDVSLLQQVQGKTGVLVVNKKDIGSAESDERYRSSCRMCQL